MLKYYNYDIVFQEIPDEVTLAINITNCPNRCKGCHSPHLFKDIGERLNENCLISILEKYAKSITCLCFMGGDASPIRINELAFFIKENYPKLKVAWYSGRSKLPKDFNINPFQYIKLGSFIPKYGDLKSKTSNQHLYKIRHDGSLKDISYMFRS
jgi:anaerobic ribonucleoside-triphosphate reductase activating protein